MLVLIFCSVVSFRAATAVPRLRFWTAALLVGSLWKSTRPSAEGVGPTLELAQLPDARNVQLPK